MEGYQDIKRAIEKLGTAHKEYRDTNDARLEAIDKGKTALASELDDKLGRIDSDVNKYSLELEQHNREVKAMAERIDELEARASEPRMTKAEQLRSDYREAFVRGIRSAFGDNDVNQEIKQLERKMHAEKSITIGTAAAGGYAVPEEIGRDIEKLERKFSPVRDLVKTVTVGTDDYKELVDIGGVSSGWVGESDTRSETNTPQLREVVPTRGEIYAYPKASEWSLDDIFFDVEAWLTETVADEFAYQEGVAVISGDGSNKPTGLLNTAPVATADWASPLRAAAAYQFVANAASPAALSGDSIIDVAYTLNTRYRAGATYVFNSTTAGAIRKLKDSNGAYLWAPGLEAGQPAMLNGYPTATWEDMEDIANNNHPVAFGNFRRGYLLVDRVTLRITVDQITQPGFVKFFIRRREGGIPLNNDAIKFIKTT